MLLASGITLWYFDPSDSGWMPKCVFKLATGLECPSCGATRAVHSLLHGHFSEALRFNYFLIVSLGYAFLAGIVWLIPKLHQTRLRRVIYGRTVGILYVVLFFSWWILRNVPAIKELL